MGYNMIQAVIPAGESVSVGIDCTRGQPTTIYTPSEWDEAPLSFEASFDNKVYCPLFDYKGVPLVKDITPGSCYVLATNLSPSWYRFRSGTKETPVTQHSDRVFTMILE
jgi:hypothetical protein